VSRFQRSSRAARPDPVGGSVLVAIPRTPGYSIRLNCQGECGFVIAIVARCLGLRAASAATPSRRPLAPHLVHTPIRKSISPPRFRHHPAEAIFNWCCRRCGRYVIGFRQPRLWLTLGLRSSSSSSPRQPRSSPPAQRHSWTADRHARIPSTSTIRARTPSKHQFRSSLFDLGYIFGPREFDLRTIVANWSLA